MIHLQVSAQWTTPDGKRLKLDEKLIDILRSIDDSGSLTLASKTLNVSYRTLWSQVKHWNAVMGHDLIQTQGRGGARLTEFGKKLMWMCEQAAVRVSNEVSSAAHQLNAEWKEHPFNRPWMNGCFSDDPVLQDLTQNTPLYQTLDITWHWAGSISSLSALHRGEVQIAGCHVPMLPGQENETLSILRKWLRGENLSVIHGFSRELGWLYRSRVNPPTLRDVAAGRALLINHPPASTTHHHLRHLIGEQGQQPEQMPGFFHEENSQLAVACSLAAGQGDLALGVREAARRYGLYFQPVCEEQYFFVFNNADWASPAVQAFLAWLRSNAVYDVVNSQVGYRAPDLGKVATLEDFLCQLTDNMLLSHTK